MKLLETMIRITINIAFLQATKWVAENSRKLKIQDIDYCL